MGILVINDTVKSCVSSVLRCMAQKCEKCWNLSIMTLRLFSFGKTRIINPGAADPFQRNLT